jgi:hypothetical protein
VTHRSGLALLLTAVAMTLVAASLAGCGVGGATFSTTGPCVIDGRAPGAYPDLEATLPRQLVTRAPDAVDSGRNCSTATLGTLASRGVMELRFAGATWDQGGGNGTTIAILTLAPESGALPVAWVEEFYESGARAGKKTGNIETSRPSMPGPGDVFRLDTLNDLSFQTVVVWPAENGVRVVLVATQVGPSAARSEHDERVAIAVEVAAMGGNPAVTPAALVGPERSFSFAGTPELLSPA